MRLSFLGAAGTVTGSRYLVEAGQARLLIDCGLYQGVKALRLRNWRPLPVDPASIDAVLLTHAHIDHSGYLPALVRDGFKGDVYCSPPTRELCEILLPDAGRLQEEDAGYANRKRVSRHQPALPLYTEQDSIRALEHLRPHDFGVPGSVGRLRFEFAPAGHILGASSIRVHEGNRSVLFSGDLGRSKDLMMMPPAAPGDPDWVVIESTYGDRTHSEADPLELLAEILTRTIARGGTLLIPSFAVGRTQTLLYCFHEIFRRRLATKVPVFVNSPMATNVTKLFRRSTDYHRLSPAECESVCGMARYVGSEEESRALTQDRLPKIIISASGMASGGRVLHHLKGLAPDRRNTILLAGFQAAGTRGDAMARGVAAIKIHGSYTAVEAEVVQMDVFSAHADQRELLDWIGQCSRPPREVFVTHGEPVAADTLRRLMRDEFGYTASVPEYRDSVELS